MLQTDYHDGALTAYITGELDHDAAANIRAQLDGAVSALRPCQLTLDFSRVSFMDSSGIAVIIKISRRMSALGGRAWIEDPARQPQRVIDAAGIDRLVPIAMSR